MNRSAIVTLFSITLLSSCANNPHYDASKPHHTKDGFRNIYYDDNKGLWAFLKWQWERSSKEILSADAYKFDVDKSNQNIIHQDDDSTRISWIGHATFLLQFSGLNILTDPQFSDRASPVSWAGPERVVEPGIEIDELPEIDAAVISHDHYDSLDVETIIALSKHNKERELTFIVPLGMKAWFDDLGLPSIRVVELDWSESVTINDVTFTAEPSQHWGKRTLLDTFTRLWASFVISSDIGKIFFAGDTGYARHFKDIGEKYGGFNLALIPIGAYEPRWFMKSYHVSPEEAVMMHQDLRSKYSVGMHWGTFILTDEPLTEPPMKLEVALKEERVPLTEFEVYRHGETRALDHLFDKSSSKYR